MTDIPAAALPRKPVYEDGFRIGEAASWAEVEALLVALGMSAERARSAVMVRGIEGPKAFEIIAPVPLAQLAAATRAALARCR